ncbi:MAG: DUF111 family protein, partial [Methanothrix sp.]|nr:DUF111 family protein [Methanothrix sp.]
KLAALMMKQTGSLGVRVFPSLHRLVAEREERIIDVSVLGRPFRTSFKVSRLHGELLSVKPEFEECRRISEETGLPLRDVIRRLEEEGRRSIAP